MKKFLLLSLLLFSLTSLFAAERTEQQMREAATSLFNRIDHGSKKVPRKFSQLKMLKRLPKLAVYGYDDGGFAIITSDDRFGAIIGYSETQYSDTVMPCGFNWWIESVNAVMENTDKQDTCFPEIRKAGVKESVAPLLRTKWGQGSPYNKHCIWNGYQFVTGCVATAMAQVMKHYNYPERGAGTNSYTIHYSNAGDAVFSSNFNEHRYDWNNMLNQYSLYEGYSNSQAEAVALLMSDCGVSVNMNYNGTSSGAISSNIAPALKKYFSYGNKTILYSRNNYTKEKWMSMIYEELSDGHPIIYSGTDDSEGGHCFVLHGYDSTGKVYVNWGWDGNYDGFYDIDLLNPSSSEYSKNQEMVFVRLPNTDDELSKTVSLTAPGTLSQHISNEEKYKITQLKISGDLNGDDFLFIRQMTGLDKAKRTYTEGILNLLDLSEANVVSGGGQYRDDWLSTTTITKDDEFPAYLFYDGATNNDACRLSIVKLPKSLKSIGSCAFFSCGNLKEIYANITPPPETSLSFMNLDLSSCLLYVPYGSVSLYSLVDGWRNFQNIIGVEDWSVKKDSYTISFTISGNGGSVTYKDKEYKTPNNTYTITVKENEQAVFTINPFRWYEWSRFNINGITLFKDTSYGELIIPKVTSDIDLTFAFTPVSYTYADNDTRRYLRYIINGNNAILAKADTAISGEVIIPEQVTIEGKAYKVKSIEPTNGAFRGVFSGNKKITSVQLPSSLETIGNNSFYETGLKEITIPSSITNIGDFAFGYTVNQQVQAVCKVRHNV